MDILLLYKSVLKALGYEVDDGGLISMRLGDEVVPSYCGEQRQVLPIPDILRGADWNRMIAFHPLSENILRGESVVLKKLRAQVNFRLSSVISILLTELITIAADRDQHAKLSPTAGEFLSLVPNADAKTVKAFEKVLDSITSAGERRLVSVYLKRGGSYKGDNFSRVAVVSFPITDEFETAEYKIFGVSMRKDDKAAFKALFEYILPRSGGLEEYSFGTNSLSAPYFHALFKGFAKVAKQLNKVTHKFRKHLDNVDETHIDMAFEDLIADLGPYKDLIPPLAGNEGSTDKDEIPAISSTSNHLQIQARQLAAPTPAPVQAPPPPPQTHYQAPPPPVQYQQPPVAAPAPVSSGGAVSWDQIVARNPALGQQQYYGPGIPQPQVTRGGYVQQPQYNPHQPQYGYPQQPVYHQQQPQYVQQGYHAAPGVVYPGGV